MLRMVLLRAIFASSCLLWCLSPTASLAWGYQGHRVVGSIADHLLTANAKQQVARILGFDLRTAAPWADCARSVARHADDTYKYEVDPDHLEYEVPCTPFDSRSERARIVDYVKRNWFTCNNTPDGVHQHGCHETYHFEDIATQRTGFDRTLVGQNEHDLVAVIGAAIAVLTDKPPASPFSIRDKKEALFLLTHFVGDLHQPLHVGVVYLDANGARVDPDVTHKADPATETAGGNFIQDQNLSLHHEWDDIPTDIGEAATIELLAAARSVPPSQGPLADWPVAWASDTIVVSHDAFAGLAFSKTDRGWTAAFDDHAAYLQRQDAIKRAQLAKGGARLAEILNTIWP